MPKKTIPPGTRFTSLVVIRDGPLTKWGTTTSICRCDCGREVHIRNASLRTGHTRSCGCLQKALLKGKKPATFVNLVGKKFGLWSVISESKSEQGAFKWLCRCACGTSRKISACELNSGRTTNCGCKRRCASWADDLSGKKFNFLTVVNRNLNVEYQGHVRWNCICKCGNRTIVSSYALKYSKTKSCGCYQRETQWLPNFGIASRKKVQRMCRNGAKYRGLEFDLSDEEFDSLISKPCHYCGSPPSNHTTASGNGSCTYSGLDRADNLKGYTIKNAVPCCRQCNISKGTLSVEEFIEWIKRAHSHSATHYTHA